MLCICFRCCSDNIVSGKDFNLGVIIRYGYGIIVEVMNTVGEGRVLMADGVFDGSAHK
ncbi:aminopeptidase PepB, partial [Enterobacter hormaechei]